MAMLQPSPRSWSRLHQQQGDREAKEERQRKPGKVICKRAEITVLPGKWQVDVTATEIQRERASCIRAEELEDLE